MSPRARAGFKIFAASTAPSAAPAPTSVCISSIKTTQFLLLVNSLTIFLSLSSNSPLYLVPATRLPISIETSLFPSNVSGTSPSFINIANLSITAVFPTPGSPISTGLFFLLLLRI